MTPDPAHMEIRPLEVRTLGAEDLDAIFAIVESAEEAPRWPRARYEDLLSSESRSPDRPSRQRIALVARDTGSGEILGFLAAGLTPNPAAPEAELESIAVAVHARRRGIGRLLLASLVTRLRTVGMAELHLEVRASNLGAIRFYQAENFKQTGVRPRYYTDPEEDAILMTLRPA